MFGIGKYLGEQTGRMGLSAAVCLFGVLLAACEQRPRAELQTIDVRTLGPARAGTESLANLRAERAELNTKALAAVLANDDRFSLKLFGRTFLIEKANEQRPGGAWRGYVVDGERRVGWVISQTDGKYVDLTIAAGNRGYRISGTEQGDLIATEVDVDALPDESEPEIEAPEPSGKAPSQRNRRIEVLLLYDPEIRNRLGNDTAKILRFVRERQAGLDQVYRNGQNQLNAEVVIATYGTYTGPQSFNVRTQSGMLKTWLQGNGWRDRYKADLVALVVDRIEGSCGIAPVLGHRSITDLECEYKWTLAHEIGHNLGAQHQRGAGQNSSAKCNYGVRVPGMARTLMAYQCAGESCDRKPYFSDVRLNVGAAKMGRQCGTASGAQNVLTVNSTIPIAANYR